MDIYPEFGGSLRSARDYIVLPEISTEAGHSIYSICEVDVQKNYYRVVDIMLNLLQIDENLIHSAIFLLVGTE